MPNIPANTVIEFIGVLFILFGVFLLISGSGIIKIQHVSVSPGVKTLAIGIVLLLIGLIMIYLDGATFSTQISVVEQEVVPSPTITTTLIIPSSNSPTITAPLTIMGATSTPAYTPTPSSTNIPTPILSPTSTEILPQSPEVNYPSVRSTTRARLYVWPEANPLEVIMFIENDSTLTLIGKNQIAGFDWLFVEIENEARGWVKIENMVPASEFEWGEVPVTNEAGNRIISGADPDAENTNREEDSTIIQQSCRLNARNTQQISTVNIDWDLPVSAHHLILNIVGPDGRPIFTNEYLDANDVDLSEKGYSIPYTKFHEEHGYAAGTTFSFTLKANAASGQTLCSGSGSFSTR